MIATRTEGVQIVVQGPKGRPVSYRVDSDPLAIGRGEDNDIVVHDVGVSRRHLVLRREEDGWILEDQGSLNGTWREGEQLEGPTSLRSGDEIRFGETVLVFDAEVEGAVSEGYSPSTDEIRISWSHRGSDRGERTGDAVLVGRSEAIREVVAVIEKAAPTTTTVLLTGESGTGKELAARMLHDRSNRADGPFVVVNCPALPGALLEAELFGVEKGTATGVEARKGRLEMAQGGTLFLDEVGDLEPTAQAKLLRTLQEKTFERVGGRETMDLDVRFVAATNHDLKADVDEGAFRLDLYHRLNAFRIHIPPLRDRREDVPLLAEHFLERSAERPLGFSDEALDHLRAHTWPGNVRELEFLVDRAVILCEGDAIEPEHLPLDDAGGEAEGDDAAVEEAYRKITLEGVSFWEAVREPYLDRRFSRNQVRDLVERLYLDAGGSYKEMAKRLQMDDAGYRRLLNFLNHHDLTVKRKA